MLAGKMQLIASDVVAQRYSRVLPLVRRGPAVSWGPEFHADRRTEFGTAASKTRAARAGDRGNNRRGDSTEEPVAARCPHRRLDALLALPPVRRGAALPALLCSAQGFRIQSRHRAIRLENSGSAH